jgi:hypothetical protein
MQNLDGKIVLVTGAAGGIGSAICAAIRTAGGIALASDLEGHADIALDVSSEDDWRRTNDDLAREHGRLDGLVNAPDFRTRVDRDGYLAYCRQERIRYLIDHAPTDELTSLIPHGAVVARKSEPGLRDMILLELAPDPAAAVR